MADLQFDARSKTVVIRALTELGRQWATKHIDRDVTDDGTITVAFSEASDIERAAREDGLTIGELAL